MKKVHYFFLAVVSLVTFSLAQVDDFTVTLLDGSEFNLYSHLDNGTFVVMTFLFDG